MSVVEHLEDPHLRMFTVDDPRLWESRPRLSLEELAIEGVSDEEWSAFYEALAEERSPGSELPTSSSTPTSRAGCFILARCRTLTKQGESSADALGCCRSSP